MNSARYGSFADDESEEVGTLDQRDITVGRRSGLERRIAAAMMDVMASSNDDDVTIQSVRARLDAGIHPVELFSAMVIDGAAPRQVALVICVAAGTPHEDAKLRLAPFEDLWEVMCAGEERDVATVLDQHGYFDPDAVLLDAEVAIVTHLHAALELVDGVPAGHAIGLFRNLHTGRLAEAFLQLERLGANRWTANRTYWAALSEAGARFPPGRDDVAAAHRRCRERARQPQQPSD